MARKKSTKRNVRRTQKEPVFEGVGHFSEEVGNLGERFGRSVERKGEEWDSWFHRTFGVVGPFVSSVFGIIILALAIRVLGFINAGLGSAILSSVHDFLLANVGLFFLMFLFFSYTSYLSKANNRAYLPFSPILTAIGAAVGFWVAMKGVLAVNAHMQMQAVERAAAFVLDSLFWVFWFVLLLGYVVLLARKPFERPAEGRAVMRKAPRRAAPGGVHRLYRSGNDRILGGVCGGIADYLGIDPVIIRILWILGTILLWGSGLLFYVIAWIIIPRNPDHKWG